MITVDACVWVAILDAADPFHLESRRFLQAIVAKALTLFIPAFALVEIGCAVARRRRDFAKGQSVVASLKVMPFLRILDTNQVLLELALAEGTSRFIRGSGRTVCGHRSTLRLGPDYLGRRTVETLRWNHTVRLARCESVNHLRQSSSLTAPCSLPVLLRWVVFWFNRKCFPVKFSCHIPISYPYQIGPITEAPKRGWISRDQLLGTLKPLTGSIRVT